MMSGSFKGLAWLGAAWGPGIVTSEKVETFLTGKPLTDETLKLAAELVRQAVKPISDVRATAEYRGQVAANLIRRLATVQPVGPRGINGLA